MPRAGKAIFGRVLTAIVTPFTSRGAVDYRSAAKLLKHLQKQCDGIVVAGTTGEGPTLSERERLRLVSFYKERCKRGFRVLANIGTNDTAESVRLAKAAAKAGADGLMAVGPYYNKPNIDGQLAHFTRIADATELPLLLYNIPGRTGLRVAHDVIVELAATTRVCAVKDATGDIEGVARLRSQTLSSFYIYSGDDSLTLPMLAVGGCGVVSVASHLIGREIGGMIRAFERGEIAQAREIHLHFLALMTGIFSTTNPIPVKAAMARLGLCKEYYRLPMTPLSKELSSGLDNLLNEYRLLT
ncbi:4-hydroxy-tetrahydrodipicolinate synthase [bacterium]|nr:4-hydroxy-tetrahydrodipicolinate synthase [bacterium]